MPKDISFKEVKALAAYYKELTSRLGAGTRAGSAYSSALSSQVDELWSRDFFSRTAEKLLSGEELDLSSVQLQLFLSQIYYSIYGNDYSSVCKQLSDNNLSQVPAMLNDMTCAQNPLQWIITSRKKKDIATDAYKKLSDMQSGAAVRLAEETLSKVDRLKQTDTGVMIDDFRRNTLNYKKAVAEASEKAFSPVRDVPSIQRLVADHGERIQKFGSIRASLEKSADVIKESVEYLMAEELVRALGNMPVEELGRARQNLKIKYLKDAGFSTLADVFGATREEIAAAYGISDDAASSIKDICENYAKQVRRGIKIRLSTDDQTKHATRVVMAIFNYIKQREFVNRIDALDAKCGASLSEFFDRLSQCKSNAAWIFYSPNELEQIRESYKNVKIILSSYFLHEADDIIKSHKKLKEADEKSAWEDFAINSISYYNVIEDLLPGVLGTDDSIYGLPEDLARQIQDECIFPNGLLCQLRKYQEWGVKYILHQERVLLGDEMGLGKTIQAIATMVSLKNTGATHFLVICPASVITNWCREIVKHSKLRVIKIHGTGKPAAIRSWIKTGGVAVTNYESTSHFKLDDDFRFELAVVDEAHYIKNELARRSINTKNIAAHAERLLFMTGTALENKVDEMISLIDVLNPSIGKTVKDMAFMSSAQNFRETIAPVYYRRKREQVLTELPDKIETREWCNLNPEEEEVYEQAILDHKFQEARRVSWNIDDLGRSSKATRLKELIDEAKAEGRKIIVFSFFLDTIRKIRGFLKDQCLEPITGSVSVNRRQEILDEFEAAPEGTVLLAQITSGGTGLNIQSASVVIICEPQFKPSTENQAISRAYRMGQTRNVLVYRLLCEDTVDERITKLLEDKQAIFDTFADKSVAAQSIEIDDKAFKDIIKEEIDRIRKKKGLPPLEESTSSGESETFM